MSNLPALPPSWAWSTVGAVGHVMLGRQRSPKWHRGPNMRPYLRVKNVFEDRIDLSDVKEMDFPPEDYERYKLEAGDILLNEGQSPELIGRPAMYRGELPGVCFTNSLIRFQPHEGINGRYALLAFRYLLHSGRFRQEARITTNIAHLSATRFASVEFPVAPRAEQEQLVTAIEEHFSRLDAAADYLFAARARLPLLHRSILAQAIPEAGPEVRLDEVLKDIEAGKSFKTPGRRASDDEWGVIKVSAMTWGEFDPLENKAVPGDQAIDTRYEIRPDDLLLSRANTSEYVGATVLVRECRPKLLLSDKSMRLHVRENVHKPWLRFALASPQLRSQMSAVATGTSDSMRNISQEKVRNLRLKLPDPRIQQAMAERIENDLAVLSRLEAEIAHAKRRLSRIRQSVLLAGFTGRLVRGDTNDEPASVLLDRIRADRVAAEPPRLRRGAV